MDSGEILKLFKKHQVDPRKPMIFTGGVGAYILSAALSSIVGFEQIKLYERTHQEWQLQYKEHRPLHARNIKLFD